MAIGLRHPSPVRRELRPLYLGRNWLPPVVALAAYFDESSEAEIGVMAVAGYIGPVKIWDGPFTRFWWDALDSAPLPLAEFKASDCRQGKGEFDGWPIEWRNALTDDLVSLIVACRGHIAGVGAALVYDTLSGSPLLREKMKRFAYTWGVAMVCLHALRLCESKLGGDPLHLIFDDRKDLKHVVGVIFEEVLDLVPALRGRVRWPSFAPSHELPPIQAADLLAYETRKELKNRWDSPPRKPSMALRRLVEGPVHFANYDIFRDLYELTERVARGEISQSEMRQSPVIYDSSATEKIRSWPTPLGGPP